MKAQIKVLFLAIIFSLFYLTPRPVFAAVEIPPFPTCSNPSGTVTSSYPSGTFGIAGREGSFQGSDIVYTLSPDTVTQCFCAADGSGVQTNFWKVTSLTSQEINELIADGWIFIPDGSVWGLSASPYLAKNADYSCTSGGGGSSSNGGGSSNGSSNNNSGGSVLGSNTSVGQVLGLAATGNLQAIIFLLILGFVFTATGTFILRKK